MLYRPTRSACGCRKCQCLWYVMLCDVSVTLTYHFIQLQLQSGSLLYKKIVAFILLFIYWFFFRNVLNKESYLTP